VFVDAFRQGLRELSWIEGQNIVVDYRFAEGRYDRLPELATELVRLKVDVIVTGSPSPAVAAKHATATIPIVMSGVGDPVGLGLIASLARPGGNVTGLSFSVGLDSFSKSLEFIKQLVPDVRSVAVLTNPTNPAQALAVEDMQVATRSLGMQLQLLEARSPDDFDGAFAAIAKERAAALLVVTEPMLVLHQTRLTALAVEQRLPTMYGIRESVEAGGLMSYGPNLADIYRRAATYVDKILKGARPADLPVEQPTKFELVINLKTAKALGLTIPQSLLLRADEVIQ
jgi:putative ABC transport system substrate-binding protein